MKTKLPKGKLQVALEALEIISEPLHAGEKYLRKAAKETLKEIDSMPDEPTVKGFCGDCEYFRKCNKVINLCDLAILENPSPEDFCSRFEPKEKAE